MSTSSVPEKRAVDSVVSNVLQSDSTHASELQASSSSIPNIIENGNEENSGRMVSRTARKRTHHELSHISEAKEENTDVNKDENPFLALLPPPMKKLKRDEQQSQETIKEDFPNTLEVKNTIEVNENEQIKDQTQKDFNDELQSNTNETSAVMNNKNKTEISDIVVGNGESKKGQYLYCTRSDIKKYILNMDEDVFRNELCTDLCKNNRMLFEMIRGKMNEHPTLCKIFIRSLSYDTKDDTVNDIFNKFGEVKEAVIVKDRETGKSRGFGFITMSNASEALNALQEYRKAIDGREAICNLASKPQGQKNRYVRSDGHGHGHHSYDHRRSNSNGSHDRREYHQTRSSSANHHHSYSDRSYDRSMNNNEYSRHQRHRESNVSTANYSYTPNTTAYEYGGVYQSYNNNGYTYANNPPPTANNMNTVPSAPATYYPQNANSANVVQTTAPVSNLPATAPYQPSMASTATNAYTPNVPSYHY